MLKKFILMLGFTSIFLLAGCQREPSRYDAFADCLTEKGIKMYGTDSCPYCQKQKEMLDGAFDKIDYINCDIKLRQCRETNITGYPTWILANGERLIGKQPLETLADKTNCELPDINPDFNE
ncbi:hypothetical protein COY07_05980 [Candidatus Peregrinibacteria bacterium CG_4_10_14_0_2_um_filter_43_11]|nr:MAG: hypothetical protein COY07_05980 [Candidatus Peregrinibacteria bacterium CG_4_10_14_0_2_um_filter_43_11]